MRKVMKKSGKAINAYVLGASSGMELELLASGRIRAAAGGKYEVFSREAINGSGEIASAGDFFKVDGGGFPYPIKRDSFLANHRHVAGDLYDQIPVPMNAWTVDDGMCDEIKYLIEHRGLVIDETKTDKYFTAPLYGTLESAARDAVIVFYGLNRDPDGQITDVDFNFVERNEFERIYVWVE